MPQYNVRSFSRDSNRMRDSGDHINRKKAESIYTNVASNTKDNKNDNINVFFNTSGQRLLSSVGGFNVNNYDLLLNLTKGRHYTAAGGQGVLAARVNDTILTSNPDSSTKINDCITVDISNSSSFAYPDYTHNIYEGPFLFNRDASFSNLDASSSLPSCSDILSKSGLITDPSSAMTFPFAQQIAAEPLRNFHFPSTFCIPKL